jgi:uncharacterized protein YecE (DUF72 family)
LEPLAKIKIGTCAWSFDDWRGVFYPEGLASTERLTQYARHFGSVEVDSTFYAAPDPRVVAHWAEITPEDFVFSCKVPREITHERRLREVAVPFAAFLESLQPLGSKLGCVLLQLPPSFQPARDETAFRDFIRELPPQPRFAVEFRHAKWHLPRIVHLLEEHRVCWAWTDVTSLDHQHEGAFEFLPQTTDFNYVRLLGDQERRGHSSEAPRYGELLWPRDASLENWATRIRQRLEEHSPVFIYANNQFEGFAPATAQRLSALLGLPVTDFSPPISSAEDSAGQLTLL